MISKETGKVKDDFYTMGITWSSVYLLDGSRPILFEAGMTGAGKLYVDDIRSVLGQRQPAYHMLSHVHYDHCGAVSYIKDAFPSLKVAASKKAADILKRPNAIDLITKLSANVIPALAAIPGVDPDKVLHEPFRPFQVDVQLEDGQILQLDENLTVEVMATPGHTRDHMSYYIPEKRILIASEASGTLDSAGCIVTEFLFDYDAYLSSLKRLAAIPAEILCQGHRLVFVGREEVCAFFSRSIKEAEGFRNLVFEFLEAEAGSIERVVMRIKAEQWDTNEGPKQPETPYLINLKAKVTHLADKLKSSGYGSTPHTELLSIEH